MITKQAQLRSRLLACIAMVAAFWPMPVGIGYAFLGRWGRFAIALLWAFLGQTIPRMIFGADSEIHKGILLLSIIIIFADTWRIAISVLRKPLVA